MYLQPFCYLFPVVFVVLFCSFLFLIVSSLMVWWFSLVVCLYYFHFSLSVTQNSRCLICGYQDVHICWPITISTCFKQIVLQVQTHSKRSTFFYSLSSLCVFDLIFYIFMFIPLLTIVVILESIIFCLLISILVYLSGWSSAFTIYLPFLVGFFLSCRYLLLVIGFYFLLREDNLTFLLRSA